MEKSTSEIFKEFSKTGQVTDSGSSESQVALFTFRIKHLTEHLKIHKKDNATRLSLVKLVGKRKKLLGYLKNNNLDRYRQTLESLSLRK